jgi:hypothetical protein
MDRPYPPGDKSYGVQYTKGHGHNNILNICNSLVFLKAAKSPFIPLFQRGKDWNLPSNFQKALLPLKKGGREGFLGRPFQGAKVVRIFYDLCARCG